MANEELIACHVVGKVWWCHNDVTTIFISNRDHMPW